MSYFFLACSNYIMVNYFSYMDQDLIGNSNPWKEFKKALEPLNNNEEGRIFEELTRLYL